MFITGDVMAEDTRNFLSTSKAPYIVKPFSTEQLRREVEKALTLLL